MRDALAESARIGGNNGQTRSHRFERNEAACLGPGRKDADVRARIHVRELVAIEEAELTNPGQVGEQAAPLWPLTGNDERRALPNSLARGDPCLGEHIDVFLGCEAPDMQDDGGVVTAGEPPAPAHTAPPGVEVRRVDAATPNDRPPDAAAFQLARYRFAGCLRQPGRPMQPAPPLSRQP